MLQEWDVIWPNAQEVLTNIKRQLLVPAENPHLVPRDREALALEAYEEIVQGIVHFPGDCMPATDSVEAYVVDEVLDPHRGTSDPYVPQRRD
eukprot:5569812-Pyramimonas_sp.AAC.1